MRSLSWMIEPPDYGYEKNGQLVVPSFSELIRHFFKRVNVFQDRKNWVPFFSWMTVVLLVIPFAIFITHYLTFTNFLIGFVYSMIVLGTHGTIWYHRYATHHAYKFKNPVVRFVTRNLVVKLIIDELYVISHYVHHQLSEQPGDPYNVNGGWWYCFLADANHQPIHRSLSEKDYKTISMLVSHTGVKINTYEQYKKWGSISHPLWTTLETAANWAFWYGAFYLIGGHSLAVTIFAASAFWAVGVRTFNFDGHGGGKDKRKEGIDFFRKDHSINQLWPGLVTGEWHNNHHLYPNSARNDFQPYQIDYAWYYIWTLHKLGLVTSYKDDKPAFIKKYLAPYQLAHPVEA